MQDATSIIRKYVYSGMQSGALTASMKLPGARELASETGVSFVIAQKALAALAQEGLLRMEPRRGTFLADDLKSVPLSHALGTHYEKWSWFAGFSELFSRLAPSLSLMGGHSNCHFLIDVTLSAQRRQDEFMDLSPLMKELFPGKDIFFEAPLQSFRDERGRLFAMPFIFSPRVVLFNKGMFKALGCPEPAPGWDWDGFIKTVRRLRRKLPSGRVFNWEDAANVWMNFVFRAGGRLLCPDSPDPVWIDHPDTLRGLKLFAELKKALGVSNSLDYAEYEKAFAAGEAAMMLAPRQMIPLMLARGFKDWGAAPLPLVEGGKELNAQATDVICVRKSCSDLRLAKELLAVLLSEEMQDFIGGAGYGLPIRKSSAMKSVDFGDPRDTLFLHEMPKMSAEYQIDSPEISALIREGIDQIWRSGTDIEKAVSELAQAVRLFLKIRAGAKARASVQEAAE